MKSLRFFFFFLTFALLLSSCEKEDTAALAKNKALKEKVALEMKKAAADDAKKKATKKKAPKKVEKKTVKKGPKIDPILANRPEQKPIAEKDDTELDDDPTDKPIAKKVEIKPAVKVSARRKKQVTLRPAVIQIVTNFDEADATINGLPYPEYVPQGEEAGMVLPAGGPYSVEVRMGEKVKYYELYLKPNETRVLFVSSTGGGSSAVRPKKASKKETKKKEEKKKEKKEDKAPGKVTVYGKPSGMIMVDGVAKGEKTPGTIEMENGRHEIQVKYDESGEVSEKKIVRVRSGSKIKLFFRERKK